MRHAEIRRTPIIFAALAALVLAIAGFATLYHQAEAQDGSAPAKPRTLTAPVVAHNSVTLSWRDPQDNSITGYVILRRNKAIHEEGIFITVEDDTNSADTTHTDDTVEPSRKYVYRIKAINAAGLSEISSWVRAYTPAGQTHRALRLGDPRLGGPHLGQPGRRRHQRLRDPTPHSRRRPGGPVQ